MLVHTSIAAIDEGRLVELLVASPRWRSTLFAVKGIPAGSVPLLQVPLSAAPGGRRGDDDILLHVPEAPDSAVAIEVKRIKLRNGQPNRLHEFKKGVQPANRLARIGFSQVYLYVFVVVDSREQNAGRISYDDGLSPLLRNRIRDTVSTMSRHHHRQKRHRTVAAGVGENAESVSGLQQRDEAGRAS